MDTPTSLVEEIDFISDEPAPARVSRCRRLVLRIIGLTGATVLVAAFTALVIAPTVRAHRRAQCHGYLKEIGRAFHEYHQAQGHFPAPAFADRDGKPLLSWRVALLPQLGYQSLYERFHLNEPWDSPHNLALLAEMPPEFACPGGPGRRAGRTGYLVVVGPKIEVGSTNTPFEPSRGADLQMILDGTSNTLLVLETNTPVPWTKPEDLHWAPEGPLPQLASPHPDGTNALFVDGSVHFLKSTISPQSLLALLTSNGGEVLSDS